jgi:50S ribosomal subunit-associated GTPase HflX
LTGAGLDSLREAVLGHVQRGSVEVTVLIQHTAGKLMNELMQAVEPKARRYVAEGVELDLFIQRTQLEQLKGRFPTLRIIAEGHADPVDDGSLP